MAAPKIPLVLDPFAKRQWTDPNYTGSRFPPGTESLFLQKVNEFYQSEKGILKPGYADFCKHLILPCFYDGVKVGAIEITDANRSLLQTNYAARTEKELKVLTRFFRSQDVEIPNATFLDVILYSRDQIEKESAAMGTAPPTYEHDYEWGIISIKAQMEDFELPMAPITMLRNALGKDQGGSGVPLCRDEYNKSVAYW
eukprot:CAMPEP_0174242694 /NCGR_PEP_ID=MMETSP0417-20130205/28782_1 /TAXON_ID=242541 /ORGANISM="Mayorella sp, Strain BSH-02190019" /LENGTH=197 /DNA_ID=CAMNT_0015322117 /DNA_START=154 /DNA_END=744 /DNA_ORIENTATION=+